MKPRKSGFSWWIIPWIILIFFVGLLGIRFEKNPFSNGIENLELATYDARVRFQGGVPFQGDRLQVVTIDNQTFSELEANPATKSDAKWPFPNSLHQGLAEKLLGWGAKAVIFDLLSFSNPSRPKYSEEDAVFASMSASLGRVAIGAKFNVSSGGAWTGGYKQTGVGMETWTTPARPFRGIPYGFVNVQLDSDGAVRRFLPYYWRLSLFPVNCLAVEGMRLASFTGLELPLAPASFSAVPPLRYFAFSNPRTIASNSISYAEIILASDTGATDNNLAKRVTGKLVFVGPTFTESHDFFSTPFTGMDAQELPTPGVFLHAMIANTFLGGHFIERLSRKTEQAIGVFFCIAGLIVSWVLPTGLGFLIMVGWGVAYSLTVYHLFAAKLIWVPLASPLLAGLGGAIPNLALRLLVSETKQAVIKQLFSVYVSSEVLNYVQSHPELLKLEGEQREATMFFSDLKGFTTISETMPPEKLSQIMNDYLTPMTEIIMNNRGYLDKYIGDAIMAVYGIPMPDPGHALNACRAAVAQQSCLSKLAKELERTSGVQVSARMGINTGTVSAGNMGSRDRFQYTVMGDAVNLASRFEGANKIFGSKIMIGENTFQEVRDRIFARLLAYLTVKGKTTAVIVYELLEMKENVPQTETGKLNEFCEEFGTAIRCFISKDLKEARKKFAEFLEKNPGDGPAEFYLDTCDELLDKGVPPDFTGGIKLDTK